MNTINQYLHNDVNAQSDTIATQLNLIVSQLNTIVKQLDRTALWDVDNFDEIYYWYK